MAFCLDRADGFVVLEGVVLGGVGLGGVGLVRGGAIVDSSLGGRIDLVKGSSA